MSFFAQIDTVVQQFEFVQVEWSLRDTSAPDTVLDSRLLAFPFLTGQSSAELRQAVREKVVNTIRPVVDAANQGLADIANLQSQLVGRTYPQQP